MGPGGLQLNKALKFHDTSISHTTSTEQARLLPSFHLTYFNFSHRKERESTITTAIMSILVIVCTKLFFICLLLFILLYLFLFLLCSTSHAHTLSKETNLFIVVILKVAATCPLTCLPTLPRQLELSHS